MTAERWMTSAAGGVLLIEMRWFWILLLCLSLPLAAASVLPQLAPAPVSCCADDDGERAPCCPPDHGCDCGCPVAVAQPLAPLATATEVLILRPGTVERIEFSAAAAERRERPPSPPPR